MSRDVKNVSVKIQTLIFLLFSLSISGEGLIFHSESISVEISLPDTVRVCGMYCFTNQSKKPLKEAIYYPFPVDSNSEYPFAITIQKDGSSDTVPFSKSENGMLFPVNIYQKDTAKYRITYSQKVHSYQGCYILTTTQKWNRALVRSDLQVSIPVRGVLTYTSYHPDSVICSDGNWKYKFGFGNFMPSIDLNFRWESPRF